MKRNYIVAALIVTLLVSSVFTGCSKPAPAEGGAPVTAPPGKVMEMSLGHSGSTTHHYQETALKFAEIVNEKTNGQIKINIFPSDQLGAGPDEVEAVKIGTQDMVIAPDAFLANHNPLFNALGMPYQFVSFEQVEKFPGSEAAKLLEEKIKDDNMVILGWNANGFRLMTSNKPIAKPEDVKGLKIRIGSAKLISDLLTTLGASPTPISMSETYTALQTGTADGQENPTTNILSNKLNEVQKFLSITRHQYVYQPLVMNKAKFEGLSPEFQKILLEAGTEVATMDVQAVKNSEAAQIEELKGMGMTVTEPDVEAFKAALTPLYAQYAKENGAEWEKLINLIKDIK